MYIKHNIFKPSPQSSKENIQSPKLFAEMSNAKLFFKLHISLQMY